MFGVDEALDLGGQDPRRQPVAGATLHLHRNSLGAGQKRDLGRRLDPTQRRRQRPAIGQPIRPQRPGHPQPDKGRDQFVHRQPSARGQPPRDQGVGAVFLFPGQDLARYSARRQGADLVQLEPGADILHPPVGMDQGAGQSLGRMPVQTGEIEQRGGRAEQKGGQPLGLQRGSQGLDTGATLIDADGTGRRCGEGHGRRRCPCRK
ncbi:hypothetical protein D3C72_1092360 [compost metagenome]